MASQPETPSAIQLVVILDKFLDWVQVHRPASYRWYKDYIESFDAEYPDLEVDKIKVHHVEEWSSKGKGKRGKITAIKRALNWAVEMEHIDVNPVARMKRPEVGHRDEFIEHGDFKILLDSVKDECFKDLLAFSWETGCRPQEATGLRDDQVDFGNQYCMISYREAKGKREARAVYLTDKAVEILKRNWREGIIFRNTRGEPWTSNAVRCRFERLEEKVGKRYCQYLLRHSFITRKLLAGVDSHVVVQLVGHKDGRMIDKHYSKIAQNHKFLAEQAKRDVDASDDDSSSSGAS